MDSVNDDAKGVGCRRIEVLTGSGQRRRWSDDDKARIIAETAQPDAVVTEVARRWQVSPQQVFGRRRQACEALAAATAPAAPVFVPIVAETPAPLSPEPVAAPTRATPPIEIKLAGAVPLHEPGDPRPDQRCSKRQPARHSKLTAAHTRSGAQGAPTPRHRTLPGVAFSGTLISIGTGRRLNRLLNRSVRGDDLDILDGKAAAVEIAGLLKISSEARIAVAYWGEGAVETLGLQKLRARKSDIHIACDLMSGATNPGEIEKLRKWFGTRSVRTVPSLHAKLWLTDRGAIIGSSNASANGLGHEGAETPVVGLVEANVRIAPFDRRLRARWEAWFDKEVWGRSEAITPAMIKLAKKLWKERRRLRDTLAGTISGEQRGGSLLQKLRTAPEFFRDKPLKIWALKFNDLTKTAEAALAREQERRESDKLTCYERVKLKPGEYILDAYWDAKAGRFEMNGLFKAAEDEPVVYRGRTQISLVYPASGFEGLTIRGEARAWKKAILAVMTTSGNKTELDITAERFATALRKASAA